MSDDELADYVLTTDDIQAIALNYLDGQVFKIREVWKRLVPAYRDGDYRCAHYLRDLDALLSNLTKVNAELQEGILE